MRFLSVASALLLFNISIGGLVLMLAVDKTADPQIIAYATMASVLAIVGLAFGIEALSSPKPEPTRPR